MGGLKTHNFIIDLSFILISYSYDLERLQQDNFSTMWTSITTLFITLWLVIHPPALTHEPENIMVFWLYVVYIIWHSRIFGICISSLRCTMAISTLTFTLIWHLSKQCAIKGHRNSTPISFPRAFRRIIKNIPEKHQPKAFAILSLGVHIQKPF